MLVEPQRCFSTEERLFNLQLCWDLDSYSSCSLEVFVSTILCPVFFPLFTLSTCGHPTEALKLLQSHWFLKNILINNTLNLVPKQPHSRSLRRNIKCHDSCFLRVIQLIYVIQMLLSVWTKRILWITKFSCFCALLCLNAVSYMITAFLKNLEYESTDRIQICSLRLFFW